MKFIAPTNKPRAAFTLAEVLAALMFMAIVIPVAVEALRTASLAGEVARRKSTAARIADRVLNESVVTTNWGSGAQSGTVTEGASQFQWTLKSNMTPDDTMEQLTAKVEFSAQGQVYSVNMSTLAGLPESTTPQTGMQ